MEQVMQTWEVREVPVLKAIYEAEESGTDIAIPDVVEATHLDPDDAERAVRSLWEAGFIQGIDVSTAGENFGLMNIRLLEKGRRAIGQWPSQDPFDNLTHLLEAMIATEQDPQKRSKLQSFAGQVAEVGKDVLTNVLAAYARQMAGI